MFKQQLPISAARFSRSATVLALGATVTFTGILGAAPANAASSDIVSTTETQKDTWRQELLTKINDYRATEGLKPFKYSDTISHIAQDEADKNVRVESISHSGNFANDPRKGDIMGGSEISAWNSQLSTTLIVDGWKGSFGHNAILLSPTIDVVGFGVAQVDGDLTGSEMPWKLVGVMDGYDYFPGDEPADTRVDVPINGGTDTPTSSNSTTINGIKVSGAIYSKFVQSGGAGTLGNPTTDERPAADGGRYQVFKKGTASTKIMWKSGTGTFAIKEFGAIGKKWAASGYERGLGYPTSDERTLADGSVYQTFKNGSAVTKVMWKGGVGTGAIKETGAIGKQWKAAGYERGYGHPFTDEVRTSDGTVYQKFKKDSRVTTIYWKSGTGIWVR